MSWFLAWKNDIKCKYMYVFMTRTNFAWLPMSSMKYVAFSTLFVNLYVVKEPVFFFKETDFRIDCECSQAILLDAMGTYGRKPSINTNHFSDNFIAFLSPRVFAALAIDLEILKDLTNSYRSVWIISSAFQDFQVFETILAKITLPSIYSDSLR